MSTAKRMVYLDNLKVFLTILVIVVHTAVTYGSEGGWYYEEPTQDMLAIVPLTMLSAISQSFFMSLFFFIGAYFVPRSFDRKGARSFLIDKVRRLGIPCLLYFYLLGPLTTYLVQVLIEKEEFVYWHSPHIGPLWFAQALLIFCAGYALFRVIYRKKPATSENIDFPGLGKIGLLALVMSLLTFAARYFYPVGEGIWGMQLGSFPQYIIMFVLGIQAYRKNWLSALDKAPARLFWIAVGVMIVLLPILMVLGEDPQYGFDFFLGGFYWQSAVFAIWESFMCIGMSVVVVLIFKNRYNIHTPVLKLMSASAYTAYIIHPVVLVSLSYLLLTLPLHPLLKFVLVVVAATLITFPLANIIRRLPGLRNIF